MRGEYAGRRAPGLRGFRLDGPRSIAGGTPGPAVTVWLDYRSSGGGPGAVQRRASRTTLAYSGPRFRAKPLPSVKLVSVSPIRTERGRGLGKSKRISTMDDSRGADGSLTLLGPFRSALHFASAHPLTSTTHLLARS